eukprot:scaffold144_cov94-Skeletonema_dohrnii-CCMP3373.AAC.9
MEVDNKSNMKKHSHSENGTITYDNGDVYEGEFESNKPHGVGKMMYKDGRVQEGIWKDGKIDYDGELKLHGRGEMIYPSGSMYEGEWKESKRHGKGIYKYFASA